MTTCRLYYNSGKCEEIELRNASDYLDVAEYPDDDSMAFDPVKIVQATRRTFRARCWAGHYNHPVLIYYELGHSIWNDGAEKFV